MPFPHSFGSDNHAGVHPRFMAAIQNANRDFDLAYGEDLCTKRVEQLFRREFGKEAQFFPVFNGTGANILALQSVTRPFHACICADTAHIHVDECGAPERFTHCKLLAVPTPDGKLTPRLVFPLLYGFGVQHHSQPGVISISQPTELGTLYSPSEIAALSELAHSRGMYLHMDGSRITNAAAALGLPFGAFVTDAGVDVLSFGGTKCGMLFGDAVVLLRDELVPHFPFVRKQGAQLFSKMRFISAQFEALLQDDFWKVPATHANDMAQLLEKGLRQASGVTLTQERQTNALFAILPPGTVEPLRERHHFHTWNHATGEVRLMTSFATTEKDVSQFLSDLRLFS